MWIPGSVSLNVKKRGGVSFEIYITSSFTSSFYLRRHDTLLKLELCMVRRLSVFRKRFAFTLNCFWSTALLKFIVPKSRSVQIARLQSTDSNCAKTVTKIFHNTMKICGVHCSWRNVCIELQRSGCKRVPRHKYLTVTCLRPTHTEYTTVLMDRLFLANLYPTNKALKRKP